MKKVLHLTLKKKWFDLIASGEKKEEYRECKPYWFERLHGRCGNDYKHFDLVHFRNGYNRYSPFLIVECLGISRGKGNPLWGAPEKDVYIIKLGRIITAGQKEGRNE
jgi:hypothetical protein